MKPPESDDELYELFPPEQREQVRRERETGTALALGGVARSELFPAPGTGGMATLKQLQERNSARVLVLVRCKREGATVAVVFKTSVGPTLVSGHDDPEPGVRRTYFIGDGAMEVFSNPAMARRVRKQWRQGDWQPRLDVLDGPASPQAGAWPLVCAKCHGHLDLDRASVLAEAETALKRRRRVLRA